MRILSIEKSQIKSPYVYNNNYKQNLVNKWFVSVVFDFWTTHEHPLSSHSNIVQSQLVFYCDNMFPNHENGCCEIFPKIEARTLHSYPLWTPTHIHASLIAGIHLNITNSPSNSIASITPINGQKLWLHDVLPLFQIDLYFWFPQTISIYNFHALLAFLCDSIQYIFKVFGLHWVPTPIHKQIYLPQKHLHRLLLKVSSS